MQLHRNRPTDRPPISLRLPFLLSISLSLSPFSTSRPFRLLSLACGGGVPPRFFFASFSSFLPFSCVSISRSLLFSSFPILSLACFFYILWYYFICIYRMSNS